MPRSTLDRLGIAHGDADRLGASYPPAAWSPYAEGARRAAACKIIIAGAGGGALPAGHDRRP